jgi:two-component system, cell cycle response regulator
MIDPKKILSSSQLPTLPSVAMKLLELARDPETEFKDVINVVKADPAITTKILKAANSSFFGFKSPVTSIERAVPLLGTTVVTTLALSFSLVDAAMTSGPLAQHYTAYWKQSIVQAVAAEVLAEHYAKTLSSDCFLTGLLLDLGRLAILKTASQDYLPVLADWESKGGSLPELERAQLGFDHVTIGAELMRKWKLPVRLIDAVSRHHRPTERVLADLANAETDAAGERVVAMAAAVGDYFCTPDRGAALARIEPFASAFFQMNRPVVEEYLSKTRERIDRAGHLFSVSFEGLGTSVDLMAEASEQLAQVAVREHMASTRVEMQREATEHANHELESKNQELQERAIRDPLTKLYNRAFFAEALNAAIGAASRSAGLLAVLFSDIDHFKRLNDTYGHQFGDEVLSKVAQIHADALRRSDVVARYGGEEFVVLVHQPNEKGLERLAERLREAVQGHEFVFEGTRVPVTISIGAAIALPEREPGDLALRLVAAADEAMYGSKNSGRNQHNVRSLIEDKDRRLAQLIAQKRFSRWLVQNEIFDIPTISRALLETSTERLRIGSLAQLLGVLTAPQVEEVRRRQRLTGERFGNCAVNCGLITEDQLSVLLAIQAEPPNLLARTLTTLGLLEKGRADALLAQYRDFLSQMQPNVAAVV